MKSVKLRTQVNDREDVEKLKVRPCRGVFCERYAYCQTMNGFLGSKLGFLLACEVTAHYFRSCLWIGHQDRSLGSR